MLFDCSQMSSVGTLYESFVKEFIDSVCGKTDGSNEDRKGKGKVQAKRKRAEPPTKKGEEGPPERKKRRVEEILDDVTSSSSSKGETESGGGREGSGGGVVESEGNPCFRLIYPSAGWVRGARYDAGAGMLMLQEKNWKQPGFPQDAMHEITPNVFFPGNPSARDGLVLHSKVLARTVATKGGGRQGWVYTGTLALLLHQNVLSLLCNIF